jgi:hypothetical protein
VKALIKGDEVDGEGIWRGLEGPESEENAAFYCMQLFNCLSNAERKSHLADVEEKMFATLLALEFYKNKIPKGRELLQSTVRHEEDRTLGHSKWILPYFLRGTLKISFA